MKVRITFIEEALGTASGNPDIHKEFIASHAPDAQSMEEEVESIGVDGVVEKAKTVFPKDQNGNPFIFDYMLKGAFKDACGHLSRVRGSKSSKIRAFKKIIDGLVFPRPRKIFLQIPDGAKIGEKQRPLRGQTAKGERIALANSETVPVGTYFEFEVPFQWRGLDFSKLNGKDSIDLEGAVEEWLDYGELRGFGAWRNAGWGAFTWERLDENMPKKAKK